ncbi:MAG TPA: UDP-glucose 4-epimerase GalE [Prolixibacteraceae bacterium]|nr:UDP-glucose 4-epimerase GalE [Prolixibacteraceae bacterium]
MTKKILVTGGTGYIGSHTVVELIESGYETLIVDDLSNSSIDVLDSIQKITGKKPAFEKFDLTGTQNVRSYFENNPGIEAIIHFAAKKAVGESVEKPLLYYRNNLVSLMNILDAMKEFQIPNLVFSSSSTVYGEPDELPVTESSPVKEAASPYGNTKRISEEIIRDTLRNETAMKAICLRYFNPIGAHPSALIGELPLGVPANLVPYITQTAAGVREKLTINGNDYSTPDGTCIRDYINVVDLAKAHVVAIDRMSGNKGKNRYEVFNIGTGRGLSVMEIVNTFEKVNNLKLNYVIGPRRPGDVEAVYADPSYANQGLGWKAEKTTEETLRSAWLWEKNIRGIK